MASKSSFRRDLAFKLLAQGFLLSFSLPLRDNRAKSQLLDMD